MESIVDISGNETTARANFAPRSEVWGIVDHVLPWSNNSPTLIEIQSAWQQLKKRRESKTEQYNMSLAAAEHHLVARYYAFSTGDPFVKSSVVAYSTLKAIFNHHGFLQVLRYEKSYPCLPPTMDSVRWGFFGAILGLKDWAREHPNQPAKWGTSLEPLIKIGADLVYGKDK